MSSCRAAIVERQFIGDVGTPLPCAVADQRDEQLGPGLFALAR